MVDNKNKSGIYTITNPFNNKVYVGKTKCFWKRYHNYKYDFKHLRDRSINQYLMNSFLKYGFENFRFEVKEFCDLEVCGERELYWMDTLNTCNKEYGYNLRRDTSTGMVVSEVTSKKISERLKKEWAEGKRDSHSEKLKESWKSRDKKAQGEIFSKLKTKYFYNIEYPDGTILKEILYQELVSLGLKNVTATFHTKKKDKVAFKGFIIERVRYDQ
jgi:group I intron endonuclease